MILIDTSIWIDHLGVSDLTVHQLLSGRTVLMHPFVVGEIACGNLRNRAGVLDLLRNLPQAAVAENDEVLELVERHSLSGTGLGWVDAHLLAAVMLTPDAQLWSRDKRLDVAAQALGIRFGAAGAQLH
ncbi:MAG: type II toxin-antitoxin system VapC family toxin [Burkholderiales bacterium]